MVKVNKTEITDETHELVADPDRLVLPTSYGSLEMQEFAKQVCDPAKTFDEKRGVYVYKGSEDHYRNALNYFLMAAERIGRESRRLRLIITTHEYEWYRDDNQNRHRINTR
ncbi:MAG: hypothetical protein ACYSR3_15365 [Planctomycetota bacterium]|jgi:hypothetical protein